MIYDQFFCEKKKESVQYKAALAVTGAIQGTSREKFIRNQDQNHLTQEGDKDDIATSLK